MLARLPPPASGERLGMPASAPGDGELAVHQSREAHADYDTFAQSARVADCRRRYPRGDIWPDNPAVHLYCGKTASAAAASGTRRSDRKLSQMVVGMHCMRQRKPFVERAP